MRNADNPTFNDNAQDAGFDPMARIKKLALLRDDFSDNRKMTGQPEPLSGMIKYKMATQHNQMK